MLIFFKSILWLLKHQKVEYTTPLKSSTVESVHHRSSWCLVVLLKAVALCNMRFLRIDLHFSWFYGPWQNHLWVHYLLSSCPWRQITMKVCKLKFATGMCRLPGEIMRWGFFPLITRHVCRFFQETRGSMTCQMRYFYVSVLFFAQIECKFLDVSIK